MQFPLWPKFNERASAPVSLRAHRGGARAAARERGLFVERLEDRSLLAQLVNVGTAADVVYNLPASASVVFLEDDGVSGNGMLQLRGGNLTFDVTPFANPTGSLTLNRGNAADTITIKALPDFNAALTIGAAATPMASVSFAGAMKLAANKSLALFSQYIETTSASETTGGGHVTINADRMELNGTLNAGMGIVTIAPLANARAISLGAESAGELSLTNSELDKITAGTLTIGHSSAGTITIGGNVIRSSTTAINLISGGSINIRDGLIDTAGGDLFLSPSAASRIAVGNVGTDFNLHGTGTLRFGNGVGLQPLINHSAPSQLLDINGKVDLTGLKLLLGTLEPPVAGDLFVLINNDSNDAVIGTFNNLPEGAAF